jgi:hypothetical protein
VADALDSDFNTLPTVGSCDEADGPPDMYLTNALSLFYRYVIVLHGKVETLELAFTNRYLSEYLAGNILRLDQTIYIYPFLLIYTYRVLNLSRR